MIHTREMQTPAGETVWVAWHENPNMVVDGDTEEIVRGIVERNLVWYHEKRVNNVFTGDAEILMMPEREKRSDETSLEVDLSLLLTTGC